MERKAVGSQLEQQAALPVVKKMRRFLSGRIQSLHQELGLIAAYKNQLISFKREYVSYFAVTATDVKKTKKKNNNTCVTYKSVWFLCSILILIIPCSVCLVGLLTCLCHSGLAAL